MKEETFKQLEQLIQNAELKICLKVKMQQIVLKEHFGVG